jgi:adenine-specific DNA-methyltransferase
MSPNLWIEDDDANGLSSESALIAAAVSLGAREVRGWSEAEDRLAANLSKVSRAVVSRLRQQIRAGEDPLGQRFCSLRPPADRRCLGATYTPAEIIDAMYGLVCGDRQPARIVDPGAGSGRFLLRSTRFVRRAQLVGVEIDPVAAILARGNLAAAGLAERSEVILADYRSLVLPRIQGATLYIGNPPYVRHHLVAPRWKKWLTREAERLGHRASQLAGLHTYFLLATASGAVRGDFGSFITSAEWLDVNYGRLIRELLLNRLGGRSIVLIEPTATPFPDAATTAAIVSFEIESSPARIRFRRVKTIAELASKTRGRTVRREQLTTEHRWSRLSRPARSLPSGYVELGELFRVHRGQVTGANRIWIAGEHSRCLPSSVLFPTVTKARELLQAGLALIDAAALRKVIDIPTDLSLLERRERAAVEEFLKLARSAGADAGYIARTRKAWWSVGLREPAPILATYMARRPPAFVRNVAAARHINIAHGLYPREPFSERFLAAMVRYLSGAATVQQGRTYAGGLTKFEPREMERIPIPAPAMAAETQT